MDLNAFMQSYADEINGQYSEYDSNKSIIIVPLPDERYQTVLGHLKHSKRYNKVGVEFTSKVCPLRENIDLKELLKENAQLNHAKFVIIDGFIYVEASAFLDTATEVVLKEIIQEVANIADEYEFKLTGEDIH
ncbi:MAG: hypothetical protein ACNS60_00205 [Candidatus Cyclobacteriaceae bacterium M2_1C_046]